MKQVSIGTVRQRFSHENLSHKKLVSIQSRSGENQAACFASKRTKSHCIAI